MLLLAMSLSLAPIFAQNLENNYQFAQGVLQQIARRAAAQLQQAKDLPVVVAHRAVAQESAERLLYQALIEVLRAEKSREIFANADSAGNAVRIDFRLAEFELSYRQLPAGWFRSGKIRRAASAAADFDLQHTRTGAIYFQGMLTETRADTLTAAQVQLVETPGSSFTAGKWEEQAAGRKLWEPLLLAAATGAVIYAFYSLRSQ